MKSRNLRCFLLLLTILSTSIQKSAAQSSVASLPGSVSRMEEVAAQADTIVVGTVVDLGLLGHSPPGQSVYRQAKLEVSQILKGNTNATIIASISVRWERGRVQETEPVLGKKYVFFIKSDKDLKLDVLKIIDGDTVSLGSVVNAIDLIARRQAGMCLV